MKLAKRDYGDDRVMLTGDARITSMARSEDQAPTAPQVDALVEDFDREGDWVPGVNRVGLAGR